MRLIDVDKLKEPKTYQAINGNLVEVEADVYGIIGKPEPIAYDVDKVVEQLDRASDYYECDEQGREHVQMINLTEAIEIVKRGGIDE